MAPGMIRLLRNLVACVLLFLGLVFVVLGMARFRPGAGDNSTTLAVGAAPEAVFPHLTAMDRAPAWIPGLQPVENLTGGPMRVGSRYRLTVKSGPETTVMEMQVTTLEPPRRLRFLLSSGQGDPSMHFTEVATYELVPDATGTLLTLSAHTDYQALMTQLLEPLITAAAQMQLTTTLGNFKRMVELAHPRK